MIAEYLIREDIIPIEKPTVFVDSRKAAKEKFDLYKKRLDKKLSESTELKKPKNPFNELAEYLIREDIIPIEKPITNEVVRLRVSSRDGLHFSGLPVLVDSRKAAKEKFDLYKKRLDKKLSESTELKKPKNALNQLFDGQLHNAKSEGLIIGKYTNKKNKAVMIEKINAILGREWSTEKINNYIENQMERVSHNAYQRKKRFERKISIYPFNRFVTVTNDPAKGLDDDEFKKSLLYYLNNMAVRHGWRYVGKFEHGTESTERLHFHAYMYIPHNEICGDLERVYRYNNKQRKVKITHQHVYIAKRFGQNDMESISPLEKMYSTCDEYIIKYCNKDNEKVVYSRGVPTEVELSVDDSYLEAVKTYMGFKYILFDDIIDVLEAEQNKRAEQELARRKKAAYNAARMAKLRERLRYFSESAI